MTSGTTSSSERVAPEEHLRQADPVLGSIIDKVMEDNGGPVTTVPDPALPVDPNMPTDHYGVLVRAIVSQNISNIASRAIYQRLRERFGGDPPTPEEILAADPDELRLAAGLSRAKTASLRSLAEHIVSGEIDLERVHLLPDDEVVAQLVAVKGIGTWTADIFLIFHLNRPDVLAAGDLEIRRAVERQYGLPGLPRPTEVERIAEPWRPHRTLACLYLWQSIETPGPA
ncbi:DNA-3-methyladenine glycosylase family protein [Kribbella qitaiheensis]|uniref:DNA-3-methyladenine glycosylase family protein n=1 Tax=Kribbella qitaiheensis TaxID=1544730 RepID=UPI003606F996